MSEENKPNFDSLIKSFSLWSERFEKQGKDWTEQDWINWGIDVTDAILDIYHYFKSMGFLIHGLNELLYKTKKENGIDTTENEENPPEPKNYFM